LRVVPSAGTGSLRFRWNLGRGWLALERPLSTLLTEAAGGKQSFAAFDRAFRESDRALERLAGIERLGFRAMVDAQTGLLLPRLTDGAGLSARAIADQFHATTCAVVRRNEALLARLQQSYHLGVVSNFTGNLELCLEELGVMRYFAVVADSGRVGITGRSRLFSTR
jgi:FMN phosphatase YigB (HAD superfamily)